jgi:hypothetical protein
MDLRAILGIGGLAVLAIAYNKNLLTTPGAGTNLAFGAGGYSGGGGGGGSF